MGNDKNIKRDRSLLPNIPSNYLNAENRAAMKELLAKQQASESVKRTTHPVQIDAATYKIIEELKEEHQVFFREIIFESVLCMKFVLDNQTPEKD